MVEIRDLCDLAVSIKSLPARDGLMNLVIYQVNANKHLIVIVLTHQILKIMNYVCYRIEEVQYKLFY